jgi:type IV secretion system protein VirB9
MSSLPRTRSALIGALLAGVLVGCAAKAPTPPPHTPVSTDLWRDVQAAATWQPPVVVDVPPPQVSPTPPAPRPVQANEQRYAWRANAEYAVAVQLGYVADVQFEPGEVPREWVAGDRAYLAHDQETRWQYVGTWSGEAEGAASQQAHHLVTCTHVGQRQGVVVVTNRRTYHLALQCVARTAARIYSWDYPAPPPLPAGPPPKRLLPDPTQPQRYEIGWRVEVPAHTAIIPPVWIGKDHAHVYVVFPPTLLAETAPLARAITATGQPVLLNYRQPAGQSVLVLDGIPPAFELRYGDGEDGPVVRVTRPLPEEGWQTIACPGDVQCPVWPGVSQRTAQE